MTILYTARGIFDKLSNEDGMSWNKYIVWSGLKHLTEVVSLDRMLNQLLVEPDHNNAADWRFIATDDKCQTGFFTTLDYVLRRLQPKERFNLLAVMVKPVADCRNKEMIGYAFMGYELLDQEYGTSVLTNCRGFNETFLPGDINNFGLIDDFEKACNIKERLLENNPMEHHAHTNVIAVWRHKTIGWKK